VRYKLDLPTAASKSVLGVNDLSAMVFSGLPAELALSFDRSLGARALGLNPDSIPEDRWPDVVRAAHVFFGNLKPVIASHVATQMAEQQVYGASAILQSTGVGNISSSWPQDMDALALQSTALFSDIVAANIQGVPLSIGNLPLPLAARAGPIYVVKNLALNLANDLAEGMTDLFSPGNPKENSIGELVEIGRLLQSLSST